ncbi:MAG TPA: VOC family protein [Allosphingosinicella sp.]|nr:VOC family protein [Allosphingosinicella sp.]
MSDMMTDADTAAEPACGVSAKAGKFIWYELMSRDREAAEAFYRAVIGWTMADAGQPDMRYTILSAGGRGMGGLMQLTQTMFDGGARPGWVGYIGVADTDAKAQEIAAAGGRILMQPGDIPDVGRFAMVADPGGAAFYLLTPLPRDEAPPPAEPTTPGLVSWHELYSSLGQEAAFAFYSSQFGWETMQEMDMGAMGTYRIFGADGVQMGGMMDKPANLPSSTWGFYINVDGIDAAVDRLSVHGGTVVMGPHEVPGGSWIVQAVDPQGAAFALVSPTR